MKLIFLTAACMVLLQTCDQRSVDHTTVFYLLLSSACTGSRPSLFLTLLPQQSRVGLGKRVGGHTARTADLNRLKKYSIPHHVMIGNKTGRGGGKEGGRSFPK